MNLLFNFIRQAGNYLINRHRKYRKVQTVIVSGIAHTAYSTVKM